MQTLLPGNSFLHDFKYLCLCLKAPQEVYDCPEEFAEFSVFELGGGLFGGAIASGLLHRFLRFHGHVKVVNLGVSSETRVDSLRASLVDQSRIN